MEPADAILASGVNSGGTISQKNPNLNSTVSNGNDTTEEFESVIVVRPMIAHSSPLTPKKSNQSPGRATPMLRNTSPSPQSTSSAFRTSSPRNGFKSSSLRGSANLGGSSTPPQFNSQAQNSSPTLLSPLPHSAIPLQFAGFGSSFGRQSSGSSNNVGSIFGSSGLLHSAVGANNTLAMSPSTKRKRSQETFTISRGLLFPSSNRDGRDERTSSRGVTSSVDEDTSDGEENTKIGKKRKTRGIIKSPQKTSSFQRHSPQPSYSQSLESGTGGGSVELIGDMDRLSIESELSGDEKASKSPKLSSQLRIDRAPEDTESAETSHNMLMDETNDEIDEDYQSRPIHPLPTRRRLRSPPPTPMVTGDDDPEEDEDVDVGDVQSRDIGGKSDSREDTLDGIPSASSLKPSNEDEDEDDYEDLAMGTMGAFYFKPTPAQRWARSQKRLQQIREYKDRESREARERRRRRRAASLSSGIGSSAASVKRKVHFAT